MFHLLVHRSHCLELAFAVAFALVNPTGLVSPAEILPGTRVAPYQLVRVRPGQDERVFVLPWSGPSESPNAIEVVKSVDGDLVWVGPPGVYMVLWFDNDSQGQAAVTITGEAPPTPPDPTPPPRPTPTPDVPNDYGLGKPAYEEAIKVNHPAQAAALAAVYNSAAAQLAALNSANWVEDLNAVVDDVRNGTNQALGQDVTLWQPWRDACRIAMNKAWDAGNRDRANWVKILKEIATALEAASRVSNTARR